MRDGVRPDLAELEEAEAAQREGHGAGESQQHEEPRPLPRRVRGRGAESPAASRPRASALATCSTRHTRCTTALPNRPLGLTSSTMMMSARATVSFRLVPMKLT